jgi:hypothetical protein
MATRKRTSRRSGLVGRAVTAGRRALREAEKRVPPDLRRQAERSIKDADKTARAAIKALQTQVNRASSRTDVNSVLKRIDGLTKQARQVIRGTGPRQASSSRRAATRTRKAAGASARKRASARQPATRKTATRKTATRKTATRKTATRKTATRKTATTTRSASARRRATTRRRPAARTTIAEMPLMPLTPMAPEPGYVIETEETTDR